MIADQDRNQSPDFTVEGKKCAAGVVCPYCDSVLNLFSSRTKEDASPQPKSGSPAICYYCFYVSIFVDQTTLRKASDYEAREIKANPMYFKILEYYKGSLLMYGEDEAT